MFTKNLEIMNYHIGASLLRDSALLFDLRRSLSYWKICKVIHVASKVVPLCVDSHSIIPDNVDIKTITKTFSGETVQSTIFLDYNTFAVRERYYLRPITNVLESEIFLKYNASYHLSQHLSMNLDSALTFPISTDSIVLLDDSATNFLSCYTTPELRFEMYVKPFQLELWICISSCLSAICIFIYVYNRYKELSPSFSPIFFFVSTLVEEPYSVPTALWNDSKFKTIAITWLLTAVIFTNLYTGLMISDLTVPLQGEILHSLEDIFGTYDKNDSLVRNSIQEDIMFWYLNYTKLHMPTDSTLIDQPRKKINYSKYDTHHKQFREIEHFALLQAPEIHKKGSFAAANETERLGNPHMYKFFLGSYETLIMLH
jgi:hypothetical protein